MTASIETIRIDGKARSAQLRESVAKAVSDLKTSHDITPGLAVVLVGEDPASKVYVGSKVRQSQEAGMNSFEHRLPESVSQDELLALVDELNGRDDVDGILVQMPLPAHIDTDVVVARIDPAKDVDGLHPFNAGQLVAGGEGLVPCTPQGCMMMIHDQLGADLSGKTAVVIGRSILVGKPMALLLTNANATVTTLHSRSPDIECATREADIVVAAVGRPQMVKGDWIKPGACVIDVGINRIPAPDKGEGKTRLVGDADTASVTGIAASVTPVPGGVGPMTVACLLANTVAAARLRRGLSKPDWS